MMPDNATIPSFGRLIGPCTISSAPGSVPGKERLGELVLVLQMIEEAALGDPDRGDHLLDRGGSEALLKHGGFGHVENALACIAALARRLLHLCSLPREARDQLYHGCT